jgi:RNA 2',3'-cyclic 3'-phosphodiesterase
LPGGLVKQLKDYQAGLKLPGAQTARWVDPGSMHLTLKFLGNVEVKRLPAVRDAISTAVKSSGRFQLLTGSTGFFPDHRKPRVFWLGLEGDIRALVILQKAVDEAMSGLGFARENRPFTAHLTLARLKDEAGVNDRAEFVRAVQARVFEPACAIEVSSVALMRSQLTARGAIYTRLAEFELPGA